MEVTKSISMTADATDIQRMPTSFFLGTRVDVIEGDLALKLAAGFASHPASGSRKVYFVNVHTVHLARADRSFRYAVNTADLVLPDGSGLKIAGALLSTPIKENLNGTDFTPRLLKLAEKNGWTVYLLGTRPDVIGRCVESIRKQFPALLLAGARHGYFTAGEEESIVREINAARPNILLVGLGSPRQEQWIHRNASRLDVGVSMAIGGLLDFIAGEYRRAPLWMRRTGIEWIYRFLQDPRSKWDRVVIEMPAFLLLVLAKRFLPKPVRSFLTRRRVAA